jgi:hypothetical protein
MRTTTLVAVFCAAVLIGCEPVTDPEVNVPDPSFASGPVTEVAFGTAYTPGPGGFSEFMRSFSFSATAKDGTVKGQFQYRILGTPYWGQGEVTCMTIVENTAYIGGVYTRAWSPNAIGDEKVFVVKDNGAGPNAVPDKITYIHDGNAQAFCADPPAWEPLVAVEKGAIVVRGGE